MKRRIGSVISSGTAAIKDGAKKKARPSSTKLDVLSYLAIQNSKESAAKQRDRANADAQLPKYQVGDKVLLFDPTTRKHQSAKLTIRYKGPYLITDIDQRHNYRLQHANTAKSVRRAVHASRLRPLIELPNDYRVSREQADRPLWQGVTQTRKLTVSVRVGDPLNGDYDGIATFVDGSFKPLDEVSEAVYDAAGLSIREESAGQYRAYDEQDVFTTSAGDIVNVDRILHAVVTDNGQSRTSQLQSTVINLLEAADKLPDVSSIAIPFTGIRVEEGELWAAAGALVKAIQQFENDTVNSPGSLTSVTFCTVCMLNADVLTVVLKQGLQVKVQTDDMAADNKLSASDGAAEVTDISDAIDTSPQASRQAATDEWWAIDKILKQRKHKGKVQYLVKWEGSDQNSWVKRADVSDFAVQAFLAERKRNKKRKVRFQ